MSDLNALKDQLEKAIAEQPKEVPLDPNEAVYLDMIVYKELAARRAMDLAKRELVDCEAQKKQLLTRVMQRTKTGPGVAISLDFERKIAKIGTDKVPS